MRTHSTLSRFGQCVFYVRCVGRAGFYFARGITKLAAAQVLYALARVSSPQP